MTAYLLTDHVLNFMAPALFTALALVLTARLMRRFFYSKTAPRQRLWTQVAIVFIANVLTLMAGLAFFGNDGKMGTYAALVLVSAICQWVLCRSWAD